MNKCGHVSNHSGTVGYGSTPDHDGERARDGERDGERDAERGVDGRGDGERYADDDDGVGDARGDRAGTTSACDST